MNISLIVYLVLTLKTLRYVRVGIGILKTNSIKNGKVAVFVVHCFVSETEHVYIRDVYIKDYLHLLTKSI